jgi:hypothetical protein
MIAVIQVIIGLLISALLSLLNQKIDQPKSEPLADFLNYSPSKISILTESFVWLTAAFATTKTA